MKAPVLALTIATAALATSSVYLWAQLREERARAAQVEDTTRELNARLAELEKARAQSRVAGNGGFIAGSFGTGPAVASTKPTPGSPPPGPNEMTPEAREVWQTMARAETPPAVLKMMRARNRAENARLYRDFAQKLGLSKEETSQLIDLLTDQQMAGLSQTHGFVDASDFRLHFDEIQRQTDAAVADLIGPDKAAQLKAYQQSLPARMEFEMLAQQLDGSDAPLSAEQRGKLLALFVEEHNRVPQPEFVVGSDDRDYMSAFNAWNDDFAQRFRARASNVFDSEQLNAYNEIQQAQKEMRDQNSGFSAVSVPFGGAVQGDVVTFAAGSGNAAFFSRSTAVMSAPAPAPAAPSKEP